MRGESGLGGDGGAQERLAGVPGAAGGGSGWAGPGGHRRAWLGSWMGNAGGDGGAQERLAGVPGGVGSGSGLGGGREGLAGVRVLWVGWLRNGGLGILFFLVDSLERARH